MKVTSSGFLHEKTSGLLPYASVWFLCSSMAYASDIFILMFSERKCKWPWISRACLGAIFRNNFLFLKT